jgi:predicted small metal-binding protein
MVKYARCNAMLSLALDENGDPCRFMAQADTEEEVVATMSQHLNTTHDVDPSDLVANIKGITKTTRR